MKHLLITGIPSTGKTTLGDHLAAHEGYSHIDMENDATRGRFRHERPTFLESLPEKTVITWGFHPVHDLEDVLFLKQSGFHLVWLDGNRPAALREFVRRGTVPEKMFYLQLFNIEHTEAVRRVAPDSVVDPFDNGGSFKDIEDIAALVGSQ